MYIFDLDGTLIDSQEAVKQAYKRVGVDMPETAWGRPSTEWLSVPQLHKQKNDYYLVCLKLYGTALPLLVYAQEYRCPVLTGASRQAVAHVQTVFGQLNMGLCGASREQKVEYLQLLKNYRQRQRKYPITYVDDDAQARDLIRKKVTCTVLSPKEACLQLSQQLEQIRVLKEKLRPS